MSEQPINELRLQLQKHKQNQRLYKDKLKEVNLTRTKINDQLDMLHQTYDKKIKHLEQRLENFKTQNQTLTKQNILFKTEIDTYQNRLLEKEKIIGLLLQQKKEPMILTSSDKSKSDKTDSLQAVEEEKGFKKQPQMRKQVDNKKDKEQASNSAKIQTVLPEQAKENGIKKESPKRPGPPPPPRKNQKAQPKTQQVQIEAPISNKAQNIQQFIEAPVTKPPTGSERAQDIQQFIQAPVVKPTPTPQVQRVQSMQQFIQAPVVKEEPVQDRAEQMQQFIQTPVVNSRPPPPKKNTKRQPPPPKPSKRGQARTQVVVFDEQEQQPQENGQALMSYFSAHSHEQETTNKSQEIELVCDPFENIDEAVQQTYPTNNNNHFDHNQNLEHHNEPEEVVISATVPYEFKDGPQDVLSHFKNNNQQFGQAEDLMAPRPIKKKQHKQKQASEVVFESYPPSNSSDFFNQLGKQGQEDPQQFDAEESSIDHIERDNSVISNEHPYFAQESVPAVEEMVKPKPVKMTKKKPKREIKVADPTLFE